MFGSYVYTKALEINYNQYEVQLMKGMDNECHP